MSTTVGSYAKMNAEQLDKEIVKLRKRKAQINGTIELLYKLRKVESAMSNSEGAQSDGAFSTASYDESNTMNETKSNFI